jgi:glycosyltransferase involved in cell wall biosynthesis
MPRPSLVNSRRSLRIVHVTPHLPPDQAANALLPAQLGEWARARGDSVHYLAHPAAGPMVARPDVTWIPRTKRSIWQRMLRVGSIIGAWRIRRDAEAILESADVVHVHSNGLLPEVGARLAGGMGKPVVLTLYGTEIWHYRRKRLGPDLFTRAYRRADAVTFYSQRLLDRARELGLDRPRCHVIYPSVAPSFAYRGEDARRDERRALGLTARNVLVNVKRLHPLAGQRYLLDAMKHVIGEHPDTRLIICGTGALLAELQGVARSAGVEAHVTFAGLVDNTLVARYCTAADLFVLPSLLEALPTVAVEALACGTPIVSSDNPGGLELHGVFGDDVQVVPREDARALADAISAALRAKRATRPSTQTIVDERFRANAVARQYWNVYAEVAGR